MYRLGVAGHVGGDRVTGRRHRVDAGVHQDPERRPVHLAADGPGKVVDQRLGEERMDEPGAARPSGARRVDDEPGIAQVGQRRGRRPVVETGELAGQRGAELGAEHGRRPGVDEPRFAHTGEPGQEEFAGEPGRADEAGELVAFAQRGGGHPEEQRVPPARLPDLARPRTVERLPEVVFQQRPSGVGAEGGQLAKGGVAATVEVGGHLGGGSRPPATGADDEDGQVAHASAQEGDQVEGVGVGPVEVVEDDQDGAVPGGLGEPSEGAVEAGGSGLTGAGVDLGRERGIAAEPGQRQAHEPEREPGVGRHAHRRSDGEALGTGDEACQHAALPQPGLAHHHQGGAAPGSGRLESIAGGGQHALPFEEVGRLAAAPGCAPDAAAGGRPAAVTWFSRLGAPGRFLDHASPTSTPLLANLGPHAGAHRHRHAGIAADLGSDGLPPRTAPHGARHWPIPASRHSFAATT